MALDALERPVRLHHRPDAGQLRPRHLDASDVAAGLGGADRRPDRHARPRPTPRRRSRARDLPNATIPPWDGTDRLNILLIGSDQRPGDGTYNTDTLIVVSIDPVTKQVAMFSLPRDSDEHPAAAGPARATPTAASTRTRSTRSSRRRAAAATSSRATSKTRGYNALKAVLGNLYGLDIKYFVEVNFDGFKQVVDALGGVTINVQVPVLDENYPSDTGRSPRVYIPAGIQHMTGAEALVYARSRHGSDDFDRGARQQRVLTSLREQADVANADPADPGAPRRLQGDGPDRHPAGPSWRSWPGSRARVDTKNIRSYVFSYPRYGTQTPGARDLQVPARTSRRSGRRSRTRSRSTRSSRTRGPRSPTRTRAIWVLNGSGQGKARRRSPATSSTTG